MAQKFTKKPVTIEAVLYQGDVGRLPYEFAAAVKSHAKGGSAFIQTLEGVMECQIGDWIIKGVKGEFYPCKPDVFVTTYAPATIYDKIVGQFAASMIGKLELNKHKDAIGWVNDGPDPMVRRLQEEVEELIDAVRYDVGEKYVDMEAADVGNMAMMVADAYKQRKVK